MGHLLAGRLREEGMQPGHREMNARDGGAIEEQIVRANVGDEPLGGEVATSVGYVRREGDIVPGGPLGARGAPGMQRGAALRHHPEQHRALRLGQLSHAAMGAINHAAPPAAIPR
ncbi:MAG: hypothetical protein H0U76_20390 [Ktedonobacteraceae bacterium]|nr:hypothetical protein [Ktedonobacteraceae bacterium]